MPGHSFKFRIPALIRRPILSITPARLLRGGRLSDAGRLPRYLGFLAIGAVCIWMPICSRRSAPVC